MCHIYSTIAEFYNVDNPLIKIRLSNRDEEILSIEQTLNYSPGLCTSFKTPSYLLQMLLDKELKKTTNFNPNGTLTVFRPIFRQIDKGR